jgi:glycosyltransferase involved in cell wall biosynthesis
MTEANRLKVNLIAYRNQHHMAGSGYARMVDVLQGRIISTPTKLNVFQRALAKALLPLITRSGSRWYHRNQLLTELNAAYRWMCSGNQIFHFLYGENSYRYLGWLKKVRPGSLIVCTYHTPPEKFQSVVKNYSHLQHIDAAIVFTKEQVDFFSNLIGKHRVHHIPHGVDVGYFTPKQKSNQGNQVVKGLFVGQHLRDFKTLASTVTRLEKRAKNLRFSIVAPLDKHHYFNKLGNVDLYHAIPDKQLLDLYQTSDIFIFPLLKATANCAIQEAMACGLPVVTTDLDAIHEYMDKSCATFVAPGDGEAFADSVYRLYKDEKLRLQMAAASRSKALQYSLDVIALKTEQVYTSLAERKHSL